MGVHHALYSAVSGLSVNTDAMGVISNNIANANTRSFKTDRAEFEDLLAVSLNENSAMGRGARLRNITTAFSQGAITSTGIMTDLAIQGDGFFAVRNDTTETQDSSGKFYTRQGSFRFDKDGFIADVQGGKVQGYMADGEGRLATKMTDLQIVSSNIPPQETTKVTLAANLDVRSAPPPEAFDVTRPQNTSNFSSSVTLYDSYGTAHTTSVYFSKSPDGDQNTWEWHALIDGKEIAGGGEADENGKSAAVEIANGKIEFDADGRPKLNYKTKDGKASYVDAIDMSDAFEVQFANGSKPQKVQFNFGPQEDENGRLNNQMTTSIAAKSNTVYHTQNGYEAGALKTMKIEQDGTIRGVYTNGLERRLGALAIATFNSIAGLAKVGRNSYVATSKSGDPRLGMAMSGTRGSVYASSLEESNVDMAQQFVDLITTQRGFQANSKAITTTDTMMEEVIQLKR